MLKRLLLLASLLWSTPSWAAITIDGTPTTGGGINTNNISISHSSTAATLALACVFERDTTLAMGTGPSVTYGGNAMTLVPGATQTQATRVKASLFYYVNPPTGSQTVAMTRSTNANRQTAANTGSVLGDFSAQCRDNTEVVSNTWGTAVASDLASATGSNAVNSYESAAITPAGTCNPGDLLFLRYVFDSASTTASATLHFINFKLIYSSESLSH